MLTQRQAWLGLESLAFAEFAQLMADPVFYGIGVPRGDGRLVLVLPGMFANDLYLEPLRFWLRRIGYRPVPSTIWMNAGCGERLAQVAEDALDRRLKYETPPVALIGHSGGGILAKAIASRLAQPPSHLILLASPVGAFVRNRWASMREAPAGMPRILAEAGYRARNMLDPGCAAPDCNCPFFGALSSSTSRVTRVTSIYTPDDPIVPNGSCQLPGARNIEVSGTHSGLAFNRDVYRLLADELARA
jgi:pimeloyl-ACP methyl ester carboxylesterase